MFQQIAERHKPGHDELRRCEDQFVGMINVTQTSTGCPPQNQECTDFALRTPISQYARPVSPLIILCIESPHLKEYQLSPPGPAAGDGSGDAGKALRLYFDVACPVHTLLPPGEYPLVLMNAIQYQCSLGDIKRYRSKVWVECWNTFAVRAFMKRLCGLYRPGDIVINACTAGGVTPKLREYVKCAVQALRIPVSLERIHPATWAREFNSARKGARNPNFEWR
jgi:hypothetical protein